MENGAEDLFYVGGKTGNRLAGNDSVLQKPVVRLLFQHSDGYLDALPRVDRVMEFNGVGAVDGAKARKFLPNRHRDILDPTALVALWLEN